MPLGFERLNERASRPNKLINFIKPLPGSGAATAERILNRVAARCYPIMKANNIAVMALEEYEPNPEFVGRNFNAGEVIQLVFKSRDGRWLSVKQVEMVMNHSRFFWRVRNAYVEELRALWAKGYTGEGLWGRGRELEGGAMVNEDELVDIVDVESLCGGTYRSRGKKRGRGGKEKPELSYAERKQRRILKKFGAGGTVLGTDEAVKTELEEGKKTKSKGKPRVASSARGRELRAAAALARFDKAKEEQQEVPGESCTESEYDSDGVDGPAALDIDGNEFRDEKGNGFIRICEDEDQDDVHVKQEMDELRELRQEKITKFTKKQPQSEENAQELIDLTKDSPPPAKSGQEPVKISSSNKRHGDNSKAGQPSTSRVNTSNSSNPKTNSTSKKSAASTQPSANMESTTTTTHVFERVATEASSLAAYNKKSTASSYERIYELKVCPRGEQVMLAIRTPTARNGYFSMTF
ncbi:DNA-dependent metalloprotease WSS1-like protein [Lasiodiplodia theobromae]|uniref:DNA-dependent metalloprotease WSS1-like protein n=1 Tax=Lasiodiplodia theobromae TaxID=45133 RepID=A0A5N5DH60_9PEZI|nr:DNA-dependent metalloprotease WSS1-like protein [Lasiodiplodia theobromae]